MSIDDVQTNLRLPIDLKERLQDAARIAGRTMTAEVVYRLEQSFVAGNRASVIADGTDWNRMRSLRQRGASLAIERATLQRARDEMFAVLPRNAEGYLEDKASRLQFLKIITRIQDVDMAINENERAIDELYDQLSSVAPGTGRSTLG